MLSPTHSPAPLSGGCGTAGFGVAQGSRCVLRSWCLGFKDIGKDSTLPSEGARCHSCPPHPPGSCRDEPRLPAGAASLPASPLISLHQQVNKLPDGRALCRIRCRQVKRCLARQSEPPGKASPTSSARTSHPGMAGPAEQPPQCSPLPGSCRFPWPAAGAAGGDGARVSLSPMLSSSPSPGTAAVPAPDASRSGFRHEELGSPGIVARGGQVRSQHGEAEVAAAVPGRRGDLGRRPPRLLPRPSLAAPAVPRTGCRSRLEQTKEEKLPLCAVAWERGGRAGCRLSPLPAAAAQGCSVGRRTKPLSRSIKEGLCGHAAKRPAACPPLPAPCPPLPAPCPALPAPCPSLPAPCLSLPVPAAGWARPRPPTPQGCPQRAHLQAGDAASLACLEGGGSCVGFPGGGSAGQPARAVPVGPVSCGQGAGG